MKISMTAQNTTATVALAWLLTVAVNVRAIELGSIGLCSGTCLKDRHCEWGLNCYKPLRDGGFPVPGCNNIMDPVAVEGEGYCYQPPSGELVIVAGYNGLPEEAFPLQACQGGCRHDGDCDYGLSCFQRDGLEEIPGCTGLGQFKWDYCFPPTSDSTLVLQNPDNNNQLSKLQACQGECFRDSDCDWGLTCFARKNNEAVPGCDGPGAHGRNYCHFPTDPKELLLMGHQGQPEHAFPLGECEGDCNSDLDCQEGLVCRHRDDDGKVAGCSGRGQGGKDYCARPTDNRQLALLTDSLYPDTTNTTIYPLLPCQGHCTSDDDCIGDYACIERNENNLVIPGCQDSATAPMGFNYCSAVTYFPGVGDNFEHGIQLSQGLTARILARSGRPVRLLGGAKSSQVFHNLPDGAAVFADPSDSGGWAYVSNSEDDQDGGVGALYFDQNGQVIQYKRLLSGTQRNCGGGKTFWQTFLTCEERLGGKVWEVDPWAETAQPTIITDSVGAYYESAAYDNRNPDKPKFYFTMDYERGPLLRCSPDPQAVTEARNANDYSSLLRGSSVNSTFEYLVLDFNSTYATSGDSHLGTGTFYWTKSKSQGSKSAFQYFKYSEGIDIRDGVLYFTTKKNKFLFILNLDENTFSQYSTESGAFASQPDQIVSILRNEHYESGALVQKERHLLYFCEDGGEKCGIHGRDEQGRFYTILQARDPRLWGETTGLAFSPDYQRMYLSFQKVGVIVEIRREDGWPFSGGLLDIKYHQDEGGDSFK